MGLQPSGPVPGLTEQAPPELLDVPGVGGPVKSFRAVVLWLLQHGISEPAQVLQACHYWREQLPIVAQMMVPNPDPAAEIGPRIVRALEVIKKGK